MLFNKNKLNEVLYRIGVSKFVLFITNITSILIFSFIASFPLIIRSYWLNEALEYNLIFVLCIAFYWLVLSNKRTKSNTDVGFFYFVIFFCFIRFEILYLSIATNLGLFRVLDILFFIIVPTNKFLSKIFDQKMYTEELWFLLSVTSFYFLLFMWNHFKVTSFFNNNFKRTSRLVDSMVEIDDLKYSIGNFNLEIERLKVNKNERVAIVGSNGSGKSTLLRFITGICKSEEGEIVNSSERMFYCPQENAAFTSLTLEENLIFFSKILGKDDLSGYMEEIGISSYDLEKNPTENYLIGRKLLIAAALMTDFDLLVLDEPTSWLDPISTQMFQRKLNEILNEKEVTLILVTHCSKEAKNMTDRVIYLEDGKLSEKMERVEEHQPLEYKLELNVVSKDKQCAIIALVEIKELVIELKGKLINEEDSLLIFKISRTDISEELLDVMFDREDISKAKLVPWVIEANN